VATSDEIRLMAFYLKPNCIEFSLETLLSTSDEIRIITNDLQHNCVEYGLKTYLTPNEKVNLALMNKVLKHVSHQAIKFVHYHSIYFLSVPNMGLKLTCTKL